MFYCLENNTQYTVLQFAYILHKKSWQALCVCVCVIQLFCAVFYRHSTGFWTFWTIARTLSPVHLFFCALFCSVYTNTFPSICYCCVEIIEERFVFLFLDRAAKIVKFLIEIKLNFFFCNHNEYLGNGHYFCY